MTKQQQKHHNSLDCDNNDYDLEFDYVSEQCFCCHKELTRIEDIRVGVEKDVYVCNRCAKEYDIETVECIDFDLCDFMCGD